MIDKDSILKRVLKLDDKLFISKLLDKAFRAGKSGIVSHSDFLDPYQKSIFQKVFSGLSDINYVLDGGYAGAEREIAVFCPDFVVLDEFDYTDYVDKRPISVLQVEVKNASGLTHRDYLGSLMGLGIKREKIGDILVRAEGCNIFVLSEIADYIIYNLNKIADSKAVVQIGDLDEVEIPDSKVREINSTVASLRLDSVASAGFGISRSKITEFIKAQKVNLNWETIDSLTKQVKEGDTISIRGKGRVILQEVGGTTKKGRIGVVLKKLL